MSQSKYLGKNITPRENRPQRRNSSSSASYSKSPVNFSMVTSPNFGNDTDENDNYDDENDVVEIKNIDKVNLVKFGKTLMERNYAFRDGKSGKDNTRNSFKTGSSSIIVLNFDLVMRASVLSILFLNFFIKDKNEAIEMLRYSVVDDYKVCTNETFTFWLLLKSKKKRALDSKERLWKRIRQERHDILDYWQSMFILPSYLLTGKSLEFKLFPSQIYITIGNKHKFIPPHSDREEDENLLMFDPIQRKTKNGPIFLFLNSSDKFLKKINKQVQDLNYQRNLTYETFSLGQDKSITWIFNEFTKIMTEHMRSCETDEEIEELDTTFINLKENLESILMESYFNIILAAFRDEKHQHLVKWFNHRLDKDFSKNSCYKTLKQFQKQFSYGIVGSFYWVANKYLKNPSSFDVHKFELSNFPSAQLLNEIEPFQNLAQADFDECFDVNIPEREENFRKIQNMLLGHWQYYMYDKQDESIALTSANILQNNVDNNSINNSKKPKITLGNLSDDDDDDDNYPTNALKNDSTDNNYSGNVLNISNQDNDNRSDTTQNDEQEQCQSGSKNIYNQDSFENDSSQTMKPIEAQLIIQTEKFHSEPQNLINQAYVRKEPSLQSQAKRNISTYKRSTINSDEEDNIQTTSSNQKRCLLTRTTKPGEGHNFQSTKR